MTTITIDGFGLLTFNRGDQFVDAFAAYTFSDKGPLKELRLSLRAQNLTNAPFRTYSGFAGRSGRYEDSADLSM